MSRIEVVGQEQDPFLELLHLVSVLVIVELGV